MIKFFRDISAIPLCRRLIIMLCFGLLCQSRFFAQSDESGKQNALILPDRADFVDPEYQFMADADVPLLSDDYIVPTESCIRAIISALPPPEEGDSGIVFGYKTDYLSASLTAAGYSYVFYDLSEDAQLPENNKKYRIMIIQNSNIPGFDELPRYLEDEYSLIMPEDNRSGTQTMLKLEMKDGYPKIDILGRFLLNFMKL